MHVPTRLSLFCIAFVSLTATALPAEPRAPCIINLDSTDRPSPSPLFFLNEAGLPFAVPKYNNNVRALTVQAGTSIVLLCAGNRFTSIPGDQAVATCVSGTTFTVNGNSVAFSSLSCTAKVSNVAESTGNTCEGGLLEARIGFKSSTNLPQINTNFRTVITVCHDQSKADSLYTKHVLNGGGVVAKDTDDSRPSFKEGSFYPQFTTMTVNTAYTQAQQTTTIGQLVGSSALAGQYVRPSESIYLARGHLTPDADFCWSEGQDATYWYINVAPQWQIFNAGNWLQVEDKVRDYAISRDRDVNIYSGTYQVTQLDDNNGNPTNIHLYLDSSTPQLPTPRFYWKVLHDPVENRAVA